MLKLVAVSMMTITAAAGATAMTVSKAWAVSLDARPEALMVGAGLLLVASILRSRLPQ
jgi:hypothetical protein